MKNYKIALGVINYLTKVTLAMAFLVSSLGIFTITSGLSKAFSPASPSLSYSILFVGFFAALACLIATKNMLYSPAAVYRSKK